MANHKYYFIPKSGKPECFTNIEQALNKRKENGFLWISFCDPSMEDLFQLNEPFELHPLSIEDCLDDKQIPKIDFYQSNTFILFNTFLYSNKELSIDEVNLFIGEKFLVTVHRSKAENIKLFEQFESILNKNFEIIKSGPAFLLHLILDKIVDQKLFAIETLEDELDDTEEKMLENETDSNPIELQRLRRDLLSFRKSLFHEREIILKICRKDSAYIPEKSIVHFKDIYDHLANFFELTENYREIVKGLIEMNLSLMNNRMAKSANHTNITMRRLTFITTIFMPLTLLSGIGGMSEWSMITGPENWKITYPLFLFSMAIIGFSSYYLLKWIDKTKSNKEI